VLGGGVDLSKVDERNIPEERFTINFKNFGANVEYKVKLYPPEIGLQLHILNNTGYALNKLGRNQEAVEAYREGINLDPQAPDLYNGLGNALRDLGRNQGAIEAYQEAISIDPQYVYAYNGLGNAFSELGRNQEAIEVYKIFISLWEGDPYWTKKANDKIKILEKLITKETK
jgi:tetratricopeptide (TPR) repeat protein